MPGFPMSTTVLRLLFGLFCISLLIMSLPAAAQQNDVEIVIRELGLGGIVQRGTWTPVRMDLTYNGAQDIEVHCRWLLTDEDGDEVIAQRSNITLQPSRTKGVWLYATPPMSTGSADTWVFQAIDTQSGELLAQETVQLDANRLAESSVNLVGICGDIGAGLVAWQPWRTQHEKVRFVSGLDIETLPDRWYGLDSLNALVWMPDNGGDPTNDMSVSSKRALREWVYRGGHLVIILPYAGQKWTGTDSGLADLIAPIETGDIKQTIARPPISVFGVLRSTEPVELNWFDLSDAKGYTSLAEVDLSTGPPGITAIPPGASSSQPDLKPMIVGKRFGFGQVTLVGINLLHDKVVGAIDPARLHRVWTRIFSWRASKTGELLPKEFFTDAETRDEYADLTDFSTDKFELGDWMSRRVAREGQTGAAIGLAFVLFVIYIIFVALTFPNLLKSKGWHRHSWTLFVCIIALFSIVAWGGAWVMRPATTSVSHFTVLDIDGNTNRVRARSWQSLLIPTFSMADVQVNSEADGLEPLRVTNLLSTPGNDLSAESPGYPDQRSYVFDTSKPNAVPVPMRSTTKSLRVDFLGQITGQQDGLKRPWTLPQAEDGLTIDRQTSLPVGEIKHTFPGPLTDVIVVYCPGGAQMPKAAGAQRSRNRPIVYRYKDPKTGQAIWEPNTPLVLPGKRNAYIPLWIKPNKAPIRNWRLEGYLGQAIADRSYTNGSGNDSNIIRDVPLLSFYGALPPPDYETEQGTYGSNVYSRSLSRDLDLTHLITGRRIILIGHIKNSSSPVPLIIDGDTIPSEGWTVVRWIYDL